MPDNWEKIREIFFAAADLPSAEQRRFLDGACRGNPDLRRDVDSLLVADRTHSRDIDLAVEAAAQQMLGADPVIGARFGSWRVSREIGRGGMGIVYLVVRDDAQFQKQAALKLIRAGMDTAELLVRFRHERQILASLDHPYIARLIDGGTRNGSECPLEQRRTSGGKAGNSTFVTPGDGAGSDTRNLRGVMPNSPPNSLNLQLV